MRVGNHRRGGGREGYIDVFAQSMALAGGYDVIMLLVSWVLYDFVISA